MMPLDVIREVTDVDTAVLLRLFAHVVHHVVIGVVVVAVVPGARAIFKVSCCWSAGGTTIGGISRRRISCASWCTVDW